jgi:threonine synthase
MLAPEAFCGGPRRRPPAISSQMTSSQPSAYLVCLDENCRARQSIQRRLYTCPVCGGLLDVGYDWANPNSRFLKSQFSERKLSADPLDRSGVWRFRELLPFVNDPLQIVTLSEGNTPLYDAPRSAEYARIDALQFKHQGLNPTGSFKDNGMTTGVTQARVLGAKAVACASTGNTSASMAAYAARAGMRSFVFIPAKQIAYGKLSQSIEYGATVVEIEGNFDDAMRIVRELADSSDVYLLNSINAFRLEGQKTIAIELLEQMEWQPPDWIVVPGGNLGNSSAIGKGLKELFDLGFVDKLPRLAVIQAAGSAPFVDLMRSPKRVELYPIEKPATLATAIKIGNPVSWRKALRAIEWTNGVVEQVSEQEIADAKAIIGLDGIGCEPASASTLAGVKRLVAGGIIKSSQRIAAILTGNLLKDPDYTINYHTGGLEFDDSTGRHSIRGTFANKTISAGARLDEIKQLLEADSS